MAIEKALQAVIFILILAGLAGISTWAINAYVTSSLLLVAGTALSWGLILLVLFVVFRELKWEWWT
jgi:hypothetical protein